MNKKDGKIKIKKSNDVIIATLYDTDIVKINNNKVTLNSGGWKTSLTKRSINRILNIYEIPIHVFIHEKEWKITSKNDVISSFKDNKEYDY